MEMSKIEQIAKKMSLKDRAALCGGLDAWRTVPFEKYGIPSIIVSDGPHGLRKKVDDEVQLALDSNLPSTCFPTSVTSASSWNREILEKIGAAIGEECLQEDVQVILGSGANIKRSPLNGRNFEYFSEDPFLSSQMAKSHISGVQSKGVGTSLKHFFANNQETDRMTVNAVIDDRVMREIYLASFEAAVKDAKPTTLMCSYNRINGTYGSENPFSLTKVLRDEWGFEGFVMSDWGAVNERADALKAGLDLEMPSSSGIGTSKIVKAVKKGTVTKDELDTAVTRLLKIIFELNESSKSDYKYDVDAHHAIAAEAFEESAVLLKNDNAILPLKKSGKIAVIGDMADVPRIQGAGSSQVTPTKTDGIFESLKSAAPDAELTYCKGYEREKNEAVDELIAEAVEAAKTSDIAIIVAGLPENFESEGFDRLHMRVPDSHIALIDAVCEVQKNTVVILINGSPVELPFADKVAAMLEIYLGGQAVGTGLARLLFGDVSPSGRLAETFPMYYENCPSYMDMMADGGNRVEVRYNEGILVGYRYFTTRKIPVRYPFGHGLSYSNFEYSNLTVSSEKIKDTDTLTVTVDVTNTGSCEAKEVVQLYVSNPETSVFRAVRELREFAKISLAPGETKTVSFELSKRAFAYYDKASADWRAEDGEYIISIGKDCENMLLSAAVCVEDTLPKPEKARKVFTRNSTLGDLMNDEVGNQLFSAILESSRGTGMAIPEDLLNENAMESVHQFAIRQVFNMWFHMPDEKPMEMLLKALNSDSGRKFITKMVKSGKVNKILKNIM